MELIKLGITIAVLVIFLYFKKPMWMTLLATSITASVVFNFGVVKTLDIALESATSVSTTKLVVVVYAIGFLQLCMSRRNKMEHTQTALSNLYNNQRVNVMCIPVFMGLLPAPNSILLAAPIIDSACEGIYDNKQKAIIASYTRHVPECILPTYAQVIIACTLGGISVGSYLIFMAPMALSMLAIVYFMYVRKIPKESGIEASGTKLANTKLLFISIWPILVIITLVIALKLEVYMATIITILMVLVIDKFKLKEVSAISSTALNIPLIAGTFAIMLFKDVIVNTGVINTIVELFDKLPLPAYIVYGLLLFVGTIITGSQAMVTLVFPMAFTAMPEVGVILAVFLMSIANGAMALSPTHICLFIVSDYYKITHKDLVLKAIPIILIQMVVSLGYYLLITAIM